MTDEVTIKLNELVELILVAVLINTSQQSTLLTNIVTTADVLNDLLTAGNLAGEGESTDDQKTDELTTEFDEGLLNELFADFDGSLLDELLAV